MKRRTQIVTALLVSALISGTVGCGGSSGPATAENAQAKASVERALKVVASDYQDSHNYFLVTPFFLKNLDHSLRAVPSLQASGGKNTFTVAVRSASGTTFVIDGNGQSIARVRRPASTACPGGHWGGSSTLTFAPVPRPRPLQQADVRRILLANVSHYAQSLSRGQQVLGTTQYPNAQAGLNAFSDPNSAANQFGAYQKDANLEGSASYVDAFDRADQFFTAANEPQAITNWEDDMVQTQGDLAQWINDAVSWQISEIPTSQLQADAATVESDLAKARVDAINASTSPGAQAPQKPEPNPSVAQVPAFVRIGSYGEAKVDQANPRPPCPATDDVSGATGDVYCVIRSSEPQTTTTSSGNDTGGTYTSPANPQHLPDCQVAPAPCFNAPYP